MNFKIDFRLFLIIKSRLLQPLWIIWYAFLKCIFQPGDVLVRVDGRTIVGYTHNDVAELFRSIPAGSNVRIDVCRGNYPLPFDPADPRTQVITTVAVAPAAVSGGAKPEATQSSVQKAPSFGARHSRTRSREVEASGQRLLVSVTRGTDGVGFTMLPARCRQHGRPELDGAPCVQDVTEPSRCGDLRRGDVLLSVDGLDVSRMIHSEVIDALKRLPLEVPVSVTVFRPGIIWTTDLWCVCFGKRNSSMHRICYQMDQVYEPPFYNVCSVCACTLQSCNYHLESKQFTVSLLSTGFIDS